jgi:uncharacterized membrane protein YeaQ/YmgE (transglycosylase-associated protein family)
MRRANAAPRHVLHNVLQVSAATIRASRMGRAASDDRLRLGARIKSGRDEPESAERRTLFKRTLVTGEWTSAEAAVTLNRTASRQGRSAWLRRIAATRRDAMSSEGLLIIVIVGVIAGWLAGQIVQGTGFGIINDLIIGIIGAFIGGWLLPRLGIHLGVGIVAAIINATVGALLLLFVLRLVRGGGRWRGGERSRWRRPR